MPTPSLTEAKLAWLIWQALETLNARLWDRYEKELLSFAMEDEDPLGDENILPEF